MHRCIVRRSGLTVALALRLRELRGAPTLLRGVPRALESHCFKATPLLGVYKDQVGEAGGTARTAQRQSTAKRKRCQQHGTIS